MLYAVNVLRLYLLPAVHPRQRRDGKDTRSLRRAAGVRKVQADGGQIVVRPGSEIVSEDLVGVHGLAVEYVEVFDPEFFRRFVQQQEHREGGKAYASAVDDLERPFGHGVGGLDHIGVYLVGVGGADHVIRMDLVAPCGPHAAGGAVLYKDLFHMLPVFDLHAHGFGAFRHFQAHFMAELFGDLGAVADVIRHQHGKDREGEGGQGVPHVDPVRRKEVHRLLRQPERVDDLFCGITGGLDERLVLYQHLRLAHRVDGQFVDAVVNGVAQPHEAQYLPKGAGHGGIDLFCKPLKAGVQRDFDPGQGGVVRLGHVQPVDIHAHIVEELADLQAVAFIADAHHFVQRRFDLNAAPDKAGGKAAGQIVPFQNKDVLALVRQHQRRRQPGKRPADNDDVVVVFVEIHLCNNLS